MQFGPVVQLVRIHACHAWGREFESRPDRLNKFNNMEYDSRNHGKAKKNTQRQSDVDIPGDSDVPEPPRVRCRLLFRNAVDRFLLDYNISILPWISLFLWALFLAT